MNNTPFSHVLIALSAFFYAMPDIVFEFLEFAVPAQLFGPDPDRMGTGYNAFLHVADFFGVVGVILFLLAVGCWVLELRSQNQETL